MRVAMWDNISCSKYIRIVTQPKLATIFREAKPRDVEADPEALEVGVLRWKLKRQNFCLYALFISCD